MRLLELRLRNFRNYERLDFTPNPGLNLFLGPNGQGKTNLLESIAILALSSSPRADRDSELIGPLVPELKLGATIERAAGQKVEIEILVRSNGIGTRRTILVDGQPKRSFDLPGYFRAVLFWPDDLSLIKAGPEARRRFLNQMLVQVEAGYARVLARYRRSIEQRNHLLRQVAAGRASPSELPVWDEEVASIAAEIVNPRQRAVDALEPLVRAFHDRISGGESIGIEYRRPPVDLLEVLRARTADDIRRGSTSVGPHRDDLLVSLDGREAGAYASQGQQRTAAVALKLAEASIVEAWTGEPPVLLLDDVLSELDLARRSALLSAVAHGGQVVITSVEASPFSKEMTSTALVMQVRAGALVGDG